MRLSFLLLLLLNLALAGWLLGAFGGATEPGHEPGRLAQQIDAARLRTLSPAGLAELRARAAANVGCVEFGDFATDAGATRALERLLAAGLGDRLVSREVPTPGWYMVYLPPMKSRAEVERRAEELRGQGVRDVHVLTDNTPMRYAIALGSFRDPELARQHRADLERRGIHEVRVSEGPSTIQATRFRFAALDPAARQQLDGLSQDFPQQKVEACPPA